MPHTRFALIFVFALVMAAITVWLLNAGGPALVVGALPVFLVAAAVLYWLRR